MALHPGSPNHSSPKHASPKHASIKKISPKTSPKASTRHENRFDTGSLSTLRQRRVKSVYNSIERIGIIQAMCEEESTANRELSCDIAKTQDGLNKRLHRLEKKTHLNPFAMD
jgi:hypothetical protein